MYDLAMCENIYKGVLSQAKEDIAQLELFAKEKNLPLRYEGLNSVIATRINTDFILFPRFKVGLPTNKGYENLHSLIVKTPENVASAIRYHLKFMKGNKIKVTNFRGIENVRSYLREFGEVSYMSYNQTESSDEFVVKKYENGNTIYQLSEDEYNLWLKYSKVEGE